MAVLLHAASHYFRALSLPADRADRCIEVQTMLSLDYGGRCMGQYDHDSCAMYLDET